MSDRPVTPIHPIHSSLLLAKFDQQGHCIALSDNWQQRIESAQTPALADKMILTEASIDFSQQLHSVFHRGEQLEAIPVKLQSCQNPPTCRLYAWREFEQLNRSSEAQAIVAVLVLEPTNELLTQELQRLRSEHELILSAAGEGIYGLDKEGRGTFANAASTRILGWHPDDVLGQPVHDIHHHSHNDGSAYQREDCHIYAALRDGVIRRIDDEVFWRKDGSCVPVEYISTPIIKNNEIQGAVIVFRDISERKAHEQQQQQQQQAFKEITTLKEELELELERNYLRQEIKSSRQFTEIIGESPALQRTLNQIEAVADTPSSVLIYGESGTGKEMIARAIHQQSSRRDGPLVKVNCASIPKDLFESEFFDHLRGSFTGAHRDRVGRLQLANGGTLFLDEIGEIPLDQQGKLLRALQEQEFERIGDEQTTKVDVRIVAATNRDLTQEVGAGRFREDLYYRLSVFPITVPALRQRLQDLALLAQHFIDLSCQELGRERLLLSKAQVKQLASHDWPGNIRELKNVIERAVILSKGKRIQLEMALPNLALSASTNAVASAENKSDTIFDDKHPVLTDQQFRELEKANIERALQDCQWKISGPNGAAFLLGIKPSTLAYRMGKLDISKPDQTDK